MSYARISPGIYKDSRTGNFFERPTVSGKKTWRKLHGRTLKLAKEELAVRRTDQARATQGLARDPYAPEPQSIGELCAEFIKADCPDRNHRPKVGQALEWATRRIESFLPFWSKRLPHQIKVHDCASYFNWRRKRIKRGKAGQVIHGGQVIDIELGLLNSVLNWAVATGKAAANPIASGRPKFRQKTINHCRDRMPLDANELHALAAHLFETRKSEALGWQLLLEAMTGCRTSEILRLRWDAKHRGQPGFIENNWLWIARSKGGVSPFVTIHPALRECLDALKRWRLWRRSKSPWFIPSFYDKGKEPAGLVSLTNALAKAGPLISGAHRTSHGLRAYYVTVRRSAGISDAQIADEIGDKSGAALIVSTYGAVPPNWRGSDALGWMPKGKPAWAVLKMPGNIECMPEGMFHVEQSVSS